MNSIKIALLSGVLLAATSAMANPPHDQNVERHDQGSSDHHGHFKRGEKLTPHYREKSYAVANYSQYHLRQPPRGYHWVRDDDNSDFVLAAIATGVIADVIANKH